LRTLLEYNTSNVSSTISPLGVPANDTISYNTALCNKFVRLGLRDGLNMSVLCQMVGNGCAPDSDVVELMRNRSFYIKFEDCNVD
jgi:hypothetical protein